MTTEPSNERGTGGKKPANAATVERSSGFTEEERTAMRERGQEAKAARRGSRASADAESDVLAKIAEMPDPDRTLAERLHALIKANAPSLSPRTWYGMPAYAKDGKIVCHFKNASKFKTRYATLGFSDQANLDDGTIWPTEFALTKLDLPTETRIIELITKAIS